MAKKTQKKSKTWTLPLAKMNQMCLIYDYPKFRDLQIAMRSVPYSRVLTANHRLFLLWGLVVALPNRLRNGYFEYEYAYFFSHHLDQFLFKVIELKDKNDHRRPNFGGR